MGPRRPRWAAIVLALAVAAPAPARAVPGGPRDEGFAPALLSKANAELAKVRADLEKIEGDLRGHEQTIIKAEALATKAREKKNPEVEAAAREYLRKARDAKARDEATRAALQEALRAARSGVESAQAAMGAWVKEYRGLIAERLAAGRDPLTQAIMSSLDDPSKRLRPISKPFSDLQPGDVLLVAPEKEGNLVRLGDRISSWEWGSQASHTLICLKSENGRKLFLDDMPGEGPLIKSEGQIQKEYGALSMDVAQPLTKPDGDKMWEAAKKLVKENLDRKGRGVVDETGYGLYGDDNMVCSEASRWALIEAGVPVPDTDSPFKKVLGIYFGPANFYADRRHFLVSAVEMPR